MEKKKTNEKNTENSGEHWHFLLPCCDDGNLCYETEIFPFTQGNLFLLGDEVFPRLTGTTPPQYQIFSFDLQSLCGFSTEQSDFSWLLGKKLRCFSLTPQQFLEVSHKLQEIPDDFGGFGEDLNRNMGFLSVVLFLTSLSDVESQRDHLGLPDKDVSPRIAPIIAYIEGNLEETLTLDEIAGQFFLSKHYLCRLFKNTTGVSVMEYIIARRVEKACVFLQQGFSVQRSGELSGFSDNSHFIRTFGKMMGTSPGKYGKTFR